MAQRFKIDIEPAVDPQDRMIEGLFVVKRDRVVIGMIEAAAISVSGGPEWIAHYYEGDSIVTHDSVFSGPVGNARALALILDRARDRS